MANSTIYPYGTGGSLPSSIGIIDDLVTGGVDKALSAQQGKVIGDVLYGQPTPSTSTWGAWQSAGSPLRAFTIAGSKTVTNGVVTFKLSSYTTYKIAIAIQDGSSFTSPTIYNGSWQTSDIVYTISSSEAGYNIRLTVGRVDNTAITTSEFLSVIAEMEYAYLAGENGLVDRVESIEDQMAGLSSLSDIIPDYIVEGGQKIDLSTIAEQTGTMIAGGIWYTTRGKHKAIAVNAGEKYVINGDGNGFWGWLSSSYSTPVTNGAPVPYATGYTNRVFQKDAVAVTVPAGAAYLCITTQNGSGLTVNWSVWKVSSYKRRTIGMAKFRFAHWNIGQFKYTNWEVGDPTHLIPAADAAEYQQKYHELLDACAADILGIAEYSATYSAAEWETLSTIFNNFLMAREGTKKGANSNSLFANIMEWVGAEEISFTASEYQRYYTHITARFLGENVHIVEAHLDHTYNEMRVAEIQQLIADMSPYKYVIIGGDFNTGDEETVVAEYGAFTSAGYTMLNSDYLGLLVTSITQEYVDNIIVKGFAMSNRKAYESSGTLSDHLLISCDLVMDMSK